MCKYIRPRTATHTHTHTHLRMPQEDEEAKEGSRYFATINRGVLRLARPTIVFSLTSGRLRTSS